MAKYRVPLSGYASTVVAVETDETDPKKIVELAEEGAWVSLCHQCADHVEVGDEWVAVEVDGKPEVYEVED
jgi:hypothetical protein